MPALLNVGGGRDETGGKYRHAGPGLAGIRSPGCLMNPGEKVKRWIRPSILAAEAYQTPTAAGLIKLDAMENPYQWPDEIKNDWLEMLRAVDINRYPDADALQLKERLRKVFSIPQGAGIISGNGSDELILIICMAVAGKNTVIMAPEPGFVMYGAVANITANRFVGVPLDKNDFSLPLGEMKAAIEEHQPAVIFLAYPNNPTGNLFAGAEIEEIVEMAPGIVVIDEAYHAFAGQTFMGELSERDNLLVMRTLSKFGLAGLRLGFLSGNEYWINEFDKLRMPYNVSVLTQRSVEFILSHMDVLNSQAEQIRADREILFDELTMLAGIKAWPSAANFILFKCLDTPGVEIFEALKSAGILVKSLNGAHPLLEDCLRVSIGTQHENELFLTAIKNLAG